MGKSNSIIGHPSNLVKHNLVFFCHSCAPAHPSRKLWSSAPIRRQVSANHKLKADLNARSVGEESADNPAPAAVAQPPTRPATLGGPSLKATAPASDAGLLSMWWLTLQEHLDDFPQLAVQFVERGALRMSAGESRYVPDQQARLGVAFDVGGIASVHTTILPRTAEDSSTNRSNRSFHRLA